MKQAPKLRMTFKPGKKDRPSFPVMNLLGTGSKTKQRMAKKADDEEDEDDNTGLLLALAAAGTLGYLGYQWYRQHQAAPEGKKPPPPPSIAERATTLMSAVTDLPGGAADLSTFERATEALGGTAVADMRLERRDQTVLTERVAIRNELQGALESGDLSREAIHGYATLVASQFRLGSVEEGAELLYGTFMQRYGAMEATETTGGGSFADLMGSIEQSDPVDRLHALATRHRELMPGLPAKAKVPTPEQMFHHLLSESEAHDHSLLHSRDLRRAAQLEPGQNRHWSYNADEALDPLATLLSPALGQSMTLLGMPIALIYDPAKDEYSATLEGDLPDAGYSVQDTVRLMTDDHWRTVERQVLAAQAAGDPELAAALMYDGMEASLPTMEDLAAGRVTAEEWDAMIHSTSRRASGVASAMYMKPIGDFSLRFGEAFKTLIRHPVSSTSSMAGWARRTVKHPLTIMSIAGGGFMTALQQIGADAEAMGLDPGVSAWDLTNPDVLAARTKMAGQFADVFAAEMGPWLSGALTSTLQMNAAGFGQDRAMASLAQRMGAGKSPFIKRLASGSYWRQVGRNMTQWRQAGRNMTQRAKDMGRFVAGGNAPGAAPSPTGMARVRSIAGRALAPAIVIEGALAGHEALHWAFDTEATSEQVSANVTRDMIARGGKPPAWYEVGGRLLMSPLNYQQAQTAVGSAVGSTDAASSRLTGEAVREAWQFLLQDQIMQQADTLVPRYLAVHPVFSTAGPSTRTLHAQRVLEGMLASVPYPESQEDFEASMAELTERLDRWDTQLRALEPTLEESAAVMQTGDSSTYLDRVRSVLPALDRELLSEPLQDWVADTWSGMSPENRSASVYTTMAVAGEMAPVFRTMYAPSKAMSTLEEQVMQLRFPNMRLEDLTDDQLVQLDAEVGDAMNGYWGQVETMLEQGVAPGDPGREGIRTLASTYGLSHSIENYADIMRLRENPALRSLTVDSPAFTDEAGDAHVAALVERQRGRVEEAVQAYHDNPSEGTAHVARRAQLELARLQHGTGARGVNYVLPDGTVFRLDEERLQDHIQHNTRHYGPLPQERGWLASPRSLVPPTPEQLSAENARADEHGWQPYVFGLADGQEIGFSQYGVQPEANTRDQLSELSTDASYAQLHLGQTIDYFTNGRFNRAQGQLSTTLPQATSSTTSDANPYLAYMQRAYPDRYNAQGEYIGPPAEGSGIAQASTTTDQVDLQRDPFAYALPAAQAHLDAEWRRRQGEAAPAPGAVATPTPQSTAPVVPRVTSPTEPLADGAIKPNPGTAPIGGG